MSGPATTDHFHEVRCPACGRLLFRVWPADFAAQIEVKCRHGDCKRLVLIGPGRLAAVAR